MFLRKFMTLKANNTTIKKEMGIRTHSSDSDHLCHPETSTFINTVCSLRYEVLLLKSSVSWLGHFKICTVYILSIVLSKFDYFKWQKKKKLTVTFAFIQMFIIPEGTILLFCFFLASHHHPGLWEHWHSTCQGCMSCQRRGTMDLTISHRIGRTCTAQ